MGNQLLRFLRETHLPDRTLPAVIDQDHWFPASWAVHLQDRSSTTGRHPAPFRRDCGAVRHLGDSFSAA
jgi:hypothetical protein